MILTTLQGIYQVLSKRCWRGPVYCSVSHHNLLITAEKLKLNTENHQWTFPIMLYIVQLLNNRLDLKNKKIRSRTKSNGDNFNTVRKPYGFGLRKKSLSWLVSRQASSPVCSCNFI